MSDLAPLIAPVRADLGRVERPRQDGMTGHQIGSRSSHASLAIQLTRQVGQAWREPSTASTSCFDAVAYDRETDRVARVTGGDRVADVLGRLDRVAVDRVMTSPARSPAAPAADPTVTSSTTAPRMSLVSSTPSWAAVSGVSGAELIPRNAGAPLTARQGIENRLRWVRSNCETDVLRLERTRRINPHHLAIEIEERATGVPRVDRRIGLNELSQAVPVIGSDRTAEWGLRRKDSPIRAMGLVLGVAARITRVRVL